jgi:iron complex transport system ATP-binding protein
LRVEKLAIGHGRRTIGNGIGFELAGGEVMCLLGPNGSGKTTLLKTLLGLLPQQAGSVSVDGQCTNGWSRQRFSRSMAYVPQQHPAFFPYNAEQAVLMGRSAHLSLLSMPSQEDYAIARRCMAQLGIERLSARLFPELSGGERQLVMIARALAQQPKILIMDEPTASLDFGNRLMVLGEIRRLADSGLAVLLSTHDPDHAFRIADRVALLDRGRLLGLGAPEQVVTAENLRCVFGVEVSVAAVSLAGKRHWVCLPVDPQD